MNDIKITTAAGELITINPGKNNDITENSTIKELKEAYAKEKARKIEGKLDDKKIEKAALEYASNLKLVLDTRILHEDITLKELLKDDVLGGKLTLSAIKINAQYVACFREIDNLDPTLSPRENLVKLERILRRTIDMDMEDDTPILANSDKAIILDAVKQNVDALFYASKVLKADSEFMLAAVQQNGESLRWASEVLKADKKIVLKAVQQNGSALRWASPELKADSEFMLAAVKQDGLALQDASKELFGKQSYFFFFKISGKNIVLAAVRQNGLALEYAAPELTKDREIVLAAVRQNGSALRWASLELKKDREIVLLAVQQNGEALRSASSELRKDRKIVLAAVKQNGEVLQDPSQALNDKTKETKSGVLSALTKPITKKISSITDRLKKGSSSSSSSSSTNKDDVNTPLLRGPKEGENLTPRNKR
jgi:hypothetical protein